MSETKKKKSSYSEERGDFWVGIITVAVVLGLFIWMFASIARHSNALSAIAMTGNSMRGNEQIFTCDVNSVKIKEGDKVVWSVNGEVVEENEYKSDEPLTFSYVPTETGEKTVTVQVGKNRSSVSVNVLPPELTITAKDVTVTYGDELPDLCYDCCGFVDGDTQEGLNYCANYAVKNCENNEEATTLNVGVYKIVPEQTCDYKDYNVNYVCGTLTVLPKRISVNNNFIKTYDQTNVIEKPAIVLSGVRDGDEVKAVCDRLYFENKNAGARKSIMLSNVELTGKDSANYVLESQIYGAIKPRRITIDGLTIKDKNYDGTTRAQIDKMGTLNGVLDGDVVAIGGIDMNFAEADVGEQEVVINNVTLVGVDKDNYIVSDVKIDNANITTTIWNKLFTTDPVVGLGA
ncbi:MAG: YDG domain-containing protein [Corallococcus sp.]|nr:YDG domain-containing protein [Bacillota bacterium]MCM1533103.1 YDG domain-containing protein [Corallococcus sp.]